MMKTPRILNASFEESIELLYGKGYSEDYEKYVRENTPKQSTPVKGLIMIFFLFIIIQAIEWISNYFYKHPEGSVLPIPKINFLPPFTALILGIIWLVGNFSSGWLIDFDDVKVRKGAIFISTYGMYAGIIFCLWMLTMLSGTSYFELLIYISPVWIILSTLMFISKKIAIEATLFGKNNDSNVLDKAMNKVFKFFIKYGGILLVLYFVFKLIFPEKINSNFGLNAGLIIFLVILGVLLLETVVVVYIFFPTVIQIFYRVKYSEKLRNFESKTQVEWYGEKYFLKHIKRTDKEQKNE